MFESSTSSNSHKLPEDFLLGAATAAHQVEGNNRFSDWWEFEQKGLLPARSGNACDQYALYESDFDLAQRWGHNCHRLSIEWSRIEPREGEWDDSAVSHYADVFGALRKRDLEPIVTLNHFTLPAWLQQDGGWTSSDTPRKFERFVERFVRQAGQTVRFWLTINEPTVYVQQGYINGEWPPLESNAWTHAFRAMRNLSEAHKLAYSAVKRAIPGAMVGFAHSALDVQPCDPSKLSHRLGAVSRDYILNELFFRMIGASGRRLRNTQHNLDFIGVNYYTRCCVKAGTSGASLLFGQACKLNHHEDSGIQSSIGWEVYPIGLAAVLERFSRYGIPMFITENGIATDDDNLRCRFLTDHLKVVADSLAEGRNIIGYVHWSLIDNFEWHLGYKPRFGLVEVDRESLDRRAKPSAELFARICQSKRVSC